MTVETNDAQAVADRAARLAAERRVDGVLTTCDYYLPAAAVAARRLGLPGPDPAVMARAVHKHRVRASLDAVGLPNPRWATAATWPEAQRAARALGYPLVAKPVDLNAGTSVRRVDGEAHVKDSFRDVAARERNTRGQPLQRLLLLEELLIGTEVSVEAVTVDGRTTVVGITDKSVAGPPAFVESGHMFPAALPADVAAEVEAFVVEVLAAVGLRHGLSHAEVMVTPAGPRLVELNPRQGGGYIFDLVHLVTGTHPLRLLVDLALGDDPCIGTAACPAPGAAVPGGSAAVVFVMAPREGTVVAADGLAAGGVRPPGRAVGPAAARRRRPPGRQRGVPRPRGHRRPRRRRRPGPRGGAGRRAAAADGGRRHRGAGGCAERPALINDNGGGDRPHRLRVRDLGGRRGPPAGQRRRGGGRGPVQRGQVVAAQRRRPAQEPGARVQDPGAHAAAELLRAPGDGTTVIDCPGYGYANVSKTTRGSWRRMIEGYLLGREQLAMVMVLVDGEVGPTPLDVQMLGWLRDNALPHTVVATKHDKVRSSQREKRKNEVAAACQLDRSDVIWVSATTGVGIDRLRDLMRLWLDLR